MLFKKKYILICLIGLIIYTLSVFTFGNKINTKINQTESSILTSKPRLEDDFYDNINYKYLNKKEYDDKEEQWGLFYTKGTKAIEKEKKEIIDNILKNCNTYGDNNIYKKICLYKESFDNKKEESIKNKLNSYISKINSSSNINDLFNNIIEINKELSLDILISPTVEINYQGESQPYFTMSLISFDDNSNDINELVYNNTIYQDEEYEQFKKHIKTYNTNMLKLYGYEKQETNNIVNDTSKFYDDISRFSLKDNDYHNNKGFNLYTKDELQKEIKNINIDKIIENYKDIYKDNEKILVIDINQLKSIDSYLINDNINIIKHYATLKILSNYTKYINNDYYNNYLEFLDNRNYYINNEISNISKDKTTEKEMLYSNIYNEFKDVITKEFINKNISKEEIEYYKKITSEYIVKLKEIINKEEWLSKETKEKAIEKVNSIKYNIPNANSVVDVSSKYEMTNNLIDNIISINKKNREEKNKQYMNKNLMYNEDLLELNAFYLTVNNSITLLSGYMYMYKISLNLNPNNLEKDYYKILGTIGLTLGHELTHSIDSTGSKYDKDGNFKNWWTKKDKNEFKKLNHKVVKYYNKYNEFGERTLGENIADLGAMNITISIADDNNATNEDYKEIFETYAKDWCFQRSSYYNSYVKGIDVHASGKARTNAVISSTDKFYEVYNIKEKDKMFIKKENRVKVW